MIGPRIEFWSDNGDLVEGEVIERNGNLTLVEDDQGKVEWIVPCQVKEVVEPCY